MISKINASYLVDSSGNALKSYSPGDFVYLHDCESTDSFGMIIGVTDSSYVTVLWSNVNLNELQYYVEGFGDYDDYEDYFDPWCYSDTAVSYPASCQEVKEIWLDDERHARRDHKRSWKRAIV